MAVTEAQVYEGLRQVIDPELWIDIVELGLVYRVEIGEMIKVTMTLTTPGCPLGSYFVERIKTAVAQATAVNPETIMVEVVFDPPWTQEMMTEEARLRLGFE